jgi:cellulose synthase/poly-beta-1,6-N-acetylglucosamine synthase-like glycosyltransferase
MKLLFWLSFWFIGYTYVGYPLLLWLQSRMAGKKIRKDPIMPTVSVVISALNEEGRIGPRLDNLLAQRYPAENLEIIVVSDGSSDGTGEIVRSFAERNVRLLELSGSRGKAVAVNLGVAESRGEVVVFADARQKFEPDVVANLAANFADPQVGCVSGELMLVEDAGCAIGHQMGAYWKYEKWIRKTESRTGSMVGATGAIYAIRRSLYQSLPEGTILDDVLTPMKMVMQGCRTVFDGDAIAFDAVSKDVKQEWTRKVRTLAGNWQLLVLAPALMLPWRNPGWWRFLSHKVFRLLVPYCLIALFAASLLQPGIFYRAAASLQFAFYGMALTGALLPAARSIRLVSLGYFFMVLNAAAVAGFWRWVTGRCLSAWKPAQGEGALP